MVLGRDEVRSVLGELTGLHRLVAALLYGSGLRLMEALRLPVKDLDFNYQTCTSTMVKAQKTGW